MSVETGSLTTVQALNPVSSNKEKVKKTILGCLRAPLPQSGGSSVFFTAFSPNRGVDSVFVFFYAGPYRFTKGALKIRNSSFP